MDVKIKMALLFVIGLFLLGLGISFTIIATQTLGIGAWDAINLRLNTLFPRFTVGTWLIIVSFFIICVSGVLMRELPKVQYLLTSIFIGMTIDITSKMLVQLSNISHIFAFFIGLILITIGSLIYLEANLLKSPIDYYMKSIMHRFQLSIGQAKIATEMSALVIALLLSAPISIGTFITIFSLGPMFGFLERPVKNLIEKI